MNIPLIKPYITEAIKKRVNDVLESGYLTEGPVTREFENLFKEYIGCTHAIAVTSCTTGLEMALRCLGIGPGHEVIVPDYTYPATAAVVSIVGATPVIVDINKETMLIDYDGIDAAVTPRTKAIIPVSLFGNPLDYSLLNRIKGEYGLFILEDAAGAIGAEYNSVKVGNFADISVFSLHPRKFITTGEGGIITTNNDEWAAWMNSYKHFGMNMNKSSREGTCFKMTGTNYKLSNVLSAIGVGQMKVIDRLLSRRRKLAGNYMTLLKGVRGITLPAVTAGGIHSFQSFCIFINNRDRIMKVMRENGIEVQIGTYSLHLHEAFRKSVRGKKYPDSRCAYDECLTLPLYHELTSDEQRTVATELQKLIALKI